MQTVSGYKGKRVLITGGLGFIGSSLAHELIRQSAHVTIYDNGLGANPNLVNIKDIKQKLVLVGGDIREPDKIAQAVANQEIIFNLAGLSSHVESNRDPFTDMDVNCRGQLVLLEAVRNLAPNARIVFAGSRAQYGKPDHLPVTEETPMRPVDMYGAHKLVGEHYHLLYHKHYGLQVTCLRKTNTFGPRHQMKHANFGVQNFFIRQALDNEPITIYDEGNQLRDYVYVNDVVHAYLLCGITSEADGKVYLLGSGNPIKLIDYARLVVKLAGSGSVTKVPFPKERKDIEIGDYFGDYSKIKRELGWEPQVSLEEGLRLTIDFYREHKKEYW